MVSSGTTSVTCTRNRVSPSTWFPSRARRWIWPQRDRSIVSSAACASTPWSIAPAYTQVDLAEVDATGAFAVNAHAVQALARVCDAKRARLLHISSDYVFGGEAARRRPLREDDPTAPVNVYGASKAMGESRASLEADDVVIMRTASLFGVAGAAGKGDNAVETMIRTAQEKGNPHSRRGSDDVPDRD